VIKKYNYCYVFKEESVIVFRIKSLNVFQYLNVNSYSSYKRNSLKKFTKIIIESYKYQYDEISDIYELVLSLGLSANATYRPSAEDIRKSRKICRKNRKIYKELTIC
jgi:hypothetical protein